MNKFIIALAIAIIGCLFVALRFDPSDRRYFGIDDLVVVALVDRAVTQQHWQPDWYAVSEQHAFTNSTILAAGEQERQRLQQNHPHHYNFAAHISSAGLLTLVARQLGFTGETTALLHHLALFYDALACLVLAALAQRLWGSRAALLAAASYAVLPLAVQSSHYARPDALLGLQAVTMLWLAHIMLTARHWWTLCVAAGVLLGAATITKASSLLYGIWPLLSFIYLLWNRQRSLIQLLLGGLLLLACASAVVILYFNAVGIDYRDFIASTQSIQHYYQNPLPPDLRADSSSLGHAQHMVSYLLHTLGAVWLSLVLIASIWLTRRQTANALLLVLPLLLISGYFISMPTFFDRSLLPLMPAYCLLLVAGGLAVSASLTRRQHSACAVILLLALIVPGSLSLTLQRHIGTGISAERKVFQQQLLQQMRQQTSIDLWIKTSSLIEQQQQQLPVLNNTQPRLYVIAHYNDPNSDHYLQLLHRVGWQQVGHYRGDFADLPTCSLHIAHEAAHYYYFIDPEAITAERQRRRQ